jgi:hypothetical protein
MADIADEKQWEHAIYVILVPNLTLLTSKALRTLSGGTLRGCSPANKAVLSMRGA